MTRHIRSQTLAALVMFFVSITSSASADVAGVFRQMFATASHVPHPSVVQVLAPDREAISRGSGTLIHVDGQFGYVITNWHVVRDAEREVLVIFPDGHQSLARILKMNKDWDLALLLIWAGSERPMPLATVGPRPGDQLTIAGYGSGDFRAQHGQFSTFAAPQPDMPFEMFEVMATARQGDSGGPIVNQRGELVGVLFGAGDGRTTGTQIGRVRMFVNEAFAELRDRVDIVAQQQSLHNEQLSGQAQASAAMLGPALLGQGAGAQVPIELAQSPPVVAGLNPSLVAAQPETREPSNPLRQPCLESAAPQGADGSPPSESDLWRAVSREGTTPNAVAVAEPNDAAARPRSVDAWQAYQSSTSTYGHSAEPRQDDVTGPQRSGAASSVPSRSSEPATAGDVGGGWVDEVASIDPASDRSGPQNLTGSRLARPAEVSRRDLFPEKGEFRANRGMRTDAPVTAAVPSDRDIVDGSAAARGTTLIGPTAIPFSGGVTWEQLRSFFAAVGVFAVLHALVKTFASAPTTKPRR